MEVTTTIFQHIIQQDRQYSDSVGANAAQNAKDDLAVKMGYNSYNELVAAAEVEMTIIKGGHINTSLIEANAITADMINADGLVVNNATIKGNIYTPMIVITEENWRDYLDTTNYGDGTDYAYINWNKSGLNIQINYWPDLVTSADTFFLSADVLRFPVGEEFLGCEANVFFTISDSGITSLGMSYMYYNTSSKRWYKKVNGFLGIGFYKLRLIDVLGLWTNDEKDRYQWAIQTFQPISDLG